MNKALLVVVYQVGINLSKKNFIKKLLLLIFLLSCMISFVFLYQKISINFLHKEKYEQFTMTIQNLNTHINSLSTILQGLETKEDFTQNQQEINQFLNSANNAINIIKQDFSSLKLQQEDLDLFNKNIIDLSLVTNQLQMFLEISSQDNLDMQNFKKILKNKDEHKH